MTRIPTHIQQLKASNQLRLTYVDASYELSAELLRVFSPSAEVRQHGNPILVSEKAHVQLEKVEPVGRYGIKIYFDDGHNTGIYSWTYLYTLATEQEYHWHTYCKSLHKAKKSRYPHTQIVQLQIPQDSQNRFKG